jgi:hypothetical protein
MSTLKPIDYLLESLEEYTRAKIDHDDEMNKYIRKYEGQPQDWITYGRLYIADLHEAKDKLERDLIHYIRLLIKEELSYVNK